MALIPIPLRKIIHINLPGIFGEIFNFDFFGLF